MNAFGLQIYSVRDKMTSREGIRATFQALKAMGYDYLQTAGAPAVSYEEYGALAQEAGLAIVGTHDNFALMCENFDQSLANHRALGTNLMGIGGFRPQTGDTDIAAWEEFIEKANKVAANCAKHGMKFTYHNHSHEFIRLANGKTPLEMLEAGLDPVNTSFVLDTCWVSAGGGDVVDWMDKLKGRLDILHLKDMVLKNSDHKYVAEYAEVGYGNLSWAPIIAKAEEIGVKHYVVEQDGKWTNGAFNSLKMSADYLAQFRK